MSRQITKLFTVLMLLTAVSAFAQDSVPKVDLAITIDTLAEAASSGTGAPAAGTAVVLNGTVLERSVINSEEAQYSAQLILGSGKWVDSSKVIISRCAILLDGPEYSTIIPARRSRTENPEELTLNSEIIVYGVFLGYAETGEGKIAVVQAGGVRKL